MVMALEQFHEKVKLGDLAAVRNALSEQPSLLNERNSAGQSALLLSHYYRQKAVAAFLLEQHPTLDIFEMCLVGDLPSLQAELNLNGDLLESYSGDGWTPLHLAAFFGQESIAKALIERGARIESRSTNAMGNTPLHAAAAGGHANLVALLIGAGARVDAQAKGGWTALHSAAQAGNLEMLQVLLRAGADCKLRADNQQTALDLGLLSGKGDVAALLEMAAGAGESTSAAVQ